MKVLFLDDDINRWRQIKEIFAKYDGLQSTWVQTASQAILALQHNTYSAVMLDHDLGGQIYVQSGKGTGYEVAEWIRDNMKEPLPKIYIHTHNPVGGQNMRNVLPTAVVCPFGELIKKL